MTESFISKRSQELKTEIINPEKDKTGLTPEIEKKLTDKLNKSGLFYPEAGDKIDYYPHLIPQLNRLITELDLPESEEALDAAITLIAKGFEFDVEIEERGEDDREIIISDEEHIKALFKSALQPEFPLMADEQLKVCVHRLAEIKPGKKFIDAFLDVVRDRSEILRSIENSEYIIDESKLLVVPDEKTGMEKEEKSNN